MPRSIVTDEEECTPRDERFYTPRAQAASARSWSSSYGTPRGDNQNSARSFFGSSSSASESEYVTPRVPPDSNYHHHSDDGMVNYGGLRRSNNVPPMHRSVARPYTAQASVSSSRRRSRSSLKNGNRIKNHHDGSLHPAVPRYPGRADGDNFQSQRATYYDRNASNRRGMMYGNNHDHHEADQQSFPPAEEIFSLARHNHCSEIENMLQRGLSPDIRDANGNTLLAIGCQNGNKRIVKMALRHGADIDACNFRGNTPLHFCFKYGFGNLLGRYLVEKGADSKSVNHDGFMPYELG
mmetsp:Transcript_11798/g.17799  ORF Transcript_11798/g.17799 Transcript_11798/m.17799 type:complete len:295 (-) Transcript_11798:1157-2041(-)